jgi:succinate dehydrogenase / fumarate reductase, membrane anchor subunit
MNSRSPSLRTDLSRVRHFGSAHSGTRHMWHMRVTTVALVPLTIAFVWLLLTIVGKDYNGVRAILGSPFASILMLLFILVGLYHMQLGMQTIIEDYVHSEGAKTYLLIANFFLPFSVGVACVYAVLKLSFV